MVQEGFKRKLTAILSADVVGYSRLMRDDEGATVRDLAAHRVLITGTIQQHHGRIVDSPGDNILADFASVVDAINGAIKIQEEIKRSNSDTPENRRMEFRIGINLGDVIEEEERIYGDGVNIAARVEGLASTGGIAISGTVYEHIKYKLSLGYRYLGEQNVKNIPEPVRVYRLLTDPEDAGKMIGEEKSKSNKFRYAAFSTLALIIMAAGVFVIWNYYFRVQIEPASLEKMAFPLPEKPSIAVLPFDNMSGDPDQEYIADGFTENIITGLSQIPEMFVIARNSTFTYKGKPAIIQQVAEDLGVKYVLEGSLMKSGEQLRITAQLIDATSGHHLWAERYDRNMTDFFDLIDEVTRKIVLSLQVELTGGERARIWYSTTASFEAWGHTVRGYSLFQHNTKEDNIRAREKFEHAIKIDPEYSIAWTYLAWTYWHDVWLGWSEHPAESFNQANDLAKKAQTLDNNQAEVHSLLSVISVQQRHYEKGVAEAEKAIALSPNNSICHVYLAWALYSVGRFDEAVKAQKRAMRLSPYYPTWYLSNLGESLTMAGQYEEAIAVNKQLLERSQKEKNQFWAIAGHAWLAIGYSMLGREEEARYHAAEVLKVYPDWSLEWEREVYSYKNPTDLERHLDALRKLGIPEHPPKKASNKG
jgi:adenylate cyclase